MAISSFALEIAVALACLPEVDSFGANDRDIGEADEAEHTLEVGVVVKVIADRPVTNPQNIRMFNSAFGHIGALPGDYYPPAPTHEGVAF